MPAFAVLEAGGRQYIVRENDQINVQKLGCGSGEEVTFDKVLMVQNGDQYLLGNPYVAGAKILCSVLGEKDLPKVVSFRIRRRKNSRRKRGSRQTMTQLQVKSIQV